MTFRLSVIPRVLAVSFCALAVAAGISAYQASTTLLRPRRIKRPDVGRPPGMLPFAYNWPTAHPMKVIGPWPWNPHDSSLDPVRRGDEVLAIEGVPLKWHTWRAASGTLRAAGAGSSARLSVHRPAKSPAAIDVEVILQREVWSPSDLDLLYREVRYLTECGEEIVGWYLPCGKQRAPTVVAIHGMAASRHAMLIAFGATLVRWGYNLLIPDGIAHGESAGPNTDLVGLRELKAAVGAAIAQPETDSARVFVLGHSYGAVKAIIAGANIPAIAGVVALACPLTVEQGIRVVAARVMGIPRSVVALSMPLLSLCVRLRTGQWIGTADALTAACHLTCPLLVFQGSLDELWDEETASTLFHAAMGEKELVIVPGVDHNGLLVAGPALEEPLLAFLHREVRRAS